MFYAGAQFVTAGHSYRTYHWDEAARLVKEMLERTRKAPASARSAVAPAAE